MVIPAHVLGCCFYIYKSKQGAERGEYSGGSGFFVAVPMKTKTDWFQCYAVTNAHVLDALPNPVLRVNRKDGEFDCIETNKDRWIFDSRGDDLAIFPLDLIRRSLVLRYPDFRFCG